MIFFWNYRYENVQIFYLWDCSTHGGGEEYIHNFSKNLGKEIRETWRWVGDNIKMVLKNNTLFWELESTDQVQGPVVVCCRYGAES